MFKLVCNIGRWGTLFESAAASEALHRFNLNSAGQEGHDGQFMIKIVRSVDDPSRWGDRPRYITLITDRADLAHLISNCINLDLGSELQTVVMAENFEQVPSQVEKIRAYCESLDRELMTTVPPPSSNPRRSVNSFLIYMVPTGCVFVVSLVALLLRVETVKRESQAQFISLSNRVDKVELGLTAKIEALRLGKGPKGDKGDRGEPGTIGDPKYIVIRDTANTVGDIVLASDTEGILPDGFVKCNGDKIRKSDYPDYFTELGLKGSIAHVPDIGTAPPGKVYLMRVQKVIIK